MFLPGTPILEIVVRGSIIYLALSWLMRGVLKRIASSISLANLLMAVIANSDDRLVTRSGAVQGVRSTPL